MSPFISALSYDPGTYRTIASSMEIGRFTDGSPPSTKAVLMDTIMHFFGVHVDVEEDGTAELRAFDLDPLNPNPTRGPTRLSFTLPEAARVELAAFDVSGRLVRALAGGVLDPGDYRIEWDGRDDRGSRLPQGVYFLRLRADERVRVRKLLLVR
jgi:hypothetical protein